MLVTESTVQQIFAETTRYPLDILDPTAHLEDDLGIDSVKRAEILLAIQKKFGLPSDLQVPPEMLTTIRNITGAISSFVKEGGKKQPPTGTDHKEEIAFGQNAGPSGPVVNQGEREVREDYQEEIEGTILSIFAETTRYPLDILDPTAHLEDDLGIDSVKRAEILLAIQKKFGLPSDLQVPPEMLTTIRNITGAISSFVKEGGKEQSSPDTDHKKETAVVHESRDIGTITGASVPVQREVSPRKNGKLIPEGHKPFGGKVALVTGSGHGIGRAIARRLATLGASVVVNSFHSREEGDKTVSDIRKEGGDAIHVWGSVANSAQLNGMFKEIDNRFGHLDFFVSNASNGIIAPFKDVNEEQWKRAFQTNVIGLHQGASLAGDLMRRRGGGKIVTLSSPGAHRYIQHFGCMGPIKAAVESLTLYMAVEFADDNIQVNCISAGPVYGDLLSKYPDSDQLIPYWESISAKNRLTEENDVSDLVTYLLSDNSNKMTGSVVLVDAGGSNRI